MRRNLKACLLGLLLLLLTLPTTAANLRTALDSVVQVETYLTLRTPEGQEKVLVAQGSGWTASCRPTSEGPYRVRVQTAAHVVDPLDCLRLMGVDESWTLVGVRYHIRYRDQVEYWLPGLAFTYRHGDSASLDFPSTLPRQSMPDGDPNLVKPGDRLITVACPDGMLFLVAEGVLSSTIEEAGVADIMPPDWHSSWWLSTVFSAPGSSGAPILNDRGEVVGQMVGRLQWPDGVLAILQPRGVIR